MKIYVQLRQVKPQQLPSGGIPTQSKSFLCTWRPQKGAGT